MGDTNGNNGNSKGIAVSRGNGIRKSTRGTRGKDRGNSSESKSESKPGDTPITTGNESAVSGNEKAVTESRLENPNGGGSPKPDDGGTGGIGGIGGSESRGSEPGGSDDNRSADSPVGVFTDYSETRKGKRGRHPRDCGCSKCAEKRNDPSNPIRVNFNSQKPRDVFPQLLTEENLTQAFRDSLSLLWQGVYQIPVLAGYGAFWALSEDEAKILTNQSEQVIKSVPSSKRKAVMDAMNSYMPIASLLSAVMVISYPRYLHMKMLAHSKPNLVKSEIKDDGKANETKRNSQEPTAIHESPRPYIIDDNEPLH